MLQGHHFRQATELERLWGGVSGGAVPFQEEVGIGLSGQAPGLPRMGVSEAGSEARGWGRGQRMRRRTSEWTLQNLSLVMYAPEM